MFRRAPLIILRLSLSDNSLSDSKTLPLILRFRSFFALLAIVLLAIILHDSHSVLRTFLTAAVTSLRRKRQRHV